MPIVDMATSKHSLSQIDPTSLTSPAEVRRMTHADDGQCTLAVIFFISTVGGTIQYEYVQYVIFVANEYTVFIYPTAGSTMA